MDFANLLLTTDKPLDKVVYLRTEAVAIPAYDYKDVTIAHGLGFLPLVNAQWSTSSDFSTSYNIGGGPNTGASRSYNTAISANATNVYLNTTNNTASAVTLYFRIYGLIPSDVNDDVTATAASADNFILNTDYNYTKLLEAGKVVGPASGGTFEYVTHSLGYRPQVSIWMTRAGFTSPFIINQITPGVPGFDQVLVAVTTTQIIFSFADVLASYTMHYRLYGDQS